MVEDYRVCTRCIMDTTDPDIQFDENGVCNHCSKNYEASKQKYFFLDEVVGRQKLDELVQMIKEKRKNEEYDCIIGVSGGVDSTFVAYQVKKLGLRSLAVHLDNGWDSELAVYNIEKILKKLDIDLYTHVLDWEEFKDLQLSFLKASVPDGEVPTDHAIVAVIYQVAAEKSIPYIFSGVNIVTEGILPIKWAYGGHDWKYIKSVHDRFGQTKLRSYPHFALVDILNYNLVKRMTFIPLLNYIPYNKREAMCVIERELDWKYYGGKHYESIYTRFFQGYILPKKFNIDKRKAHLSTLIVSGQITREEALEEMQCNPYTEEQMAEDREYVIKKLGLTEREFEEMMSLPVKSFLDYPSNYWVFSGKMRQLVRTAQKLKLLPHKVSL